MPIRNFLLVIMLALSLPPVSPARATASEQQPEPCVLSTHTITSIAPHYEDEHVGKFTIRRLRGAELFVQAEFGLTAEWLRLQIDRHMAAMHGTMPDCPFDMRAVTVTVDSLGPGFLVTVRAADDSAAKEVLRRARTLPHAEH